MAVSNSTECYKRAFESATEGIMILGPDARVLFANPAAAVILGYSNTSELVGKPPRS
jgi:PAS domain S-box-containing protein